MNDSVANALAAGPVSKTSVSYKPLWFDFQQSISTRLGLILGISGWTLFVLAWYIASQAGIASAKLFPGPDAVIVSLYDLLVNNNYLSDIGASVQRIFISFFIAVAIALPLGLIIGSFVRADAFFTPLFGAFRYLPAPAFVPLLLMWLGTGEEQKVALLVIGVLFFLIIMLSDVTRQVPSVFIETAKTLGLDRRAILWKVVFKNSLPGYVDTCRQMLAISWTYLVIAEIVAATDGIGAMMMRAKRFVHVDDIMAGILTIGILGLCFDAIFRLIYRWAFPYFSKE